MGTWAAGPFGNDSATDFVGSVVDGLMVPVDAFLASPEIDETFDNAFAAIALLNEVMSRTPTRPWDYKAHKTRSPEPIVEALLTCLDGQISDLGSDGDFQTEQRAALVEECRRFTRLLGG